MVYLTNAGEVLSHGSGPRRTTAFLKPQRLVDVMKELVHHDLKAQLEQIAAPEVAQLGQHFLRCGILERRLLLAVAHQAPVADDEAQIEFLRPWGSSGCSRACRWSCRSGSADVAARPARRWLPPMRVRSWRRSCTRWNRRPAAAMTFAQAVDYMARAGIGPAEALARGCQVALATADRILNGQDCDSRVSFVTRLRRSTSIRRSTWRHHQ